MRILVTGGLGTVGSYLVPELRSRGHRVFICDQTHEPDELTHSLAGDSDDPSYGRCDVAEFRQVEEVFRAFAPIDVVYHCAAEFGRWNGEDFYETLWRTNAIGTKNVIRMQERLGFRLVHFSSSEVYGDWPGLMVETVMDDHEVPQLNDYAMTKWVNEMQVRNSTRRFGTESVVVRLFNTYGPGERYSPYRSVYCRFIHCALAGKPWTVYRGHSRTSIFITDTVRTLANIADRFRPGETYNIGGTEPHTIDELAEMVARQTGADRSLIRYADSEVLTTRAKNVSVEKAARELGHETRIGLEEGIARTVEWMRRVHFAQR